MKYSRVADVTRLLLIQLYLFFTLCVYTLAIWYRYMVKQYFRYPYLLHIDNVFLVPAIFMYYNEQAKVKCCSYYIQSVRILYPTLSFDVSLCK